MKKIFLLQRASKQGGGSYQAASAVRPVLQKISSTVIDFADHCGIAMKTATLDNPPT